MNVFEKLQKARIELQSKKMKKSGHNKFAGYQYFELGDFLPEINKLFAELGLCSAVSFGKDLAELKIVNMEKPDEVITFTSPMAEANLKGCHPIQNLGAVETYSRRYLYVTALEIVEHDALDSSPPVGQEATVTAIHKADVKPLNAKGTLTADREEAIRRVYSGIVDCFEAKMPEKALEAYIAVSDADEKVFLQSIMDKEIKRQIVAAKKKFDETELAQQA